MEDQDPGIPPADSSLTLLRPRQLKIVPVARSASPGSGREVSYPYTVPWVERIMGWANTSAPLPTAPIPQSGTAAEKTAKPNSGEGRGTLDTVVLILGKVSQLIAWYAPSMVRSMYTLCPVDRTMD